MALEATRTRYLLKAGLSVIALFLHSHAPAQSTQIPSVEPYQSIGTGETLSPPPEDRAPSHESGGVTLAFDNRPISEIVSIVLGDHVGADFIIAPNVTASLSLRTTRPTRPADLPDLLNEVFRPQGVQVTLLRPGLYHVHLTNQETIGQTLQVLRRGDTLRSNTVILPLDHISAEDMARVLRPFLNPSTSIVADDTRQVLIVSGDRMQLQVIQDAVAVFDTDWLNALSFSLVPLQFSTPDDIIEDVKAVLSIDSGPVANRVELIALERLNAVVIVSPTNSYLDVAQEWVSRLDVAPTQGRQAYVVPLLNASAEQLASRLNELFSDDAHQASNETMTIQADIESNSLLVVASPQGLDQIESIVSTLDRAPDQVLIEARIVEVVLNDDLRYGVQWFLDTRDGGEVISTGNSGGGVGATLPGFAYTYRSDFVRAALSAIASVTDVETISSPQIMALDNRPSLIQVGDQVPVITQSAVSIADPDAPIVNSVEFRDTGVVLNVTPRIRPDGSVLMEVQQEVSSVAETTTSGIDSPTIQQRRFETSVSVQDGETVALGGLIRTARSQTQSGVPVLQNVPLVGGLFRESGDTQRRTELVVFLTPRVIRSSDDARQATQALRRRLTALQERGFGEEQ